VHFGKKIDVQIKKIGEFFAEITFHRRFFAPKCGFSVSKPQFCAFLTEIFSILVKNSPVI